MTAHAAETWTTHSAHYFLMPHLFSSLLPALPTAPPPPPPPTHFLTPPHFIEGPLSAVASRRLQILFASWVTAVLNTVIVVLIRGR